MIVPMVVEGCGWHVNQRENESRDKIGIVPIPRCKRVMAAPEVLEVTACHGLVTRDARRYRWGIRTLSTSGLGFRVGGSSLGRASCTKCDLIKHRIVGRWYAEIPIVQHRQWLCIGNYLDIISRRYRLTTIATEARTVR